MINSNDPSNIERKHKPLPPLPPKKKQPEQTEAKKMPELKETIKKPVEISPSKISKATQEKSIGTDSLHKNIKKLFNTEEKPKLTQAQKPQEQKPSLMINIELLVDKNRKSIIHENMSLDKAIELLNTGDRQNSALYRYDPNGGVYLTKMIYDNKNDKIFFTQNKRIDNQGFTFDELRHIHSGIYDKKDNVRWITPSS